MATTSYGVASLIVRDKRWILSSNWLLGGAVAMTTGLAVTVAVEKIALTTKVWDYSPKMPRKYGIGISPILQWIIIPMATIALNRKLIKRI